MLFEILKNKTTINDWAENKFLNKQIIACLRLVNNVYDMLRDTNPKPIKRNNYIQIK